MLNGSFTLASTTQGVKRFVTDRAVIAILILPRNDIVNRTFGENPPGNNFRCLFGQPNLMN